MRNVAARPDYLPYIDGLRAVAVLAVVLYHLNAAWLPGGFTGVDIFFVISGFVVSASVDRLERVGAGESLLRFYARRLRRIAPALIVCLLVTCVVSGLFIPQAWLSDTSRETGRMAFFGLSNWVLAGTGNDYFSPKVEFNPFTHTWSLGVEEQFYLVFPFLFLAWVRGGRGRVWSLLLFAAALVSSLGYAWWLSKAGGREVEGFYLTTSRFWQLAAGVVLYQSLATWGGIAGASDRAAHPGTQRRQSLRNMGLALSAGLIIAGLVFARPGHSPWPDGVLPVLGTIGLLALVYEAQSGWMGRMLSWSPVVAIGRISYSLYLWHWPVFVLFRWTVGLETTVLRAVALMLAFALAIASYRFVERPLRHSPRLVRMRDWRFVTAAVLVVVVSGTVYRHVARHHDDYSLSVVTRNAQDWHPSGEKLDREYPGCHLQPRNVQVQGNVAWVYERSGCNKPVTDSRRIFVAGDSHAAGYSEMLQRLVYESGRPVTLYAVGGCPLVSLQAGREDSPDCQAYAEGTLADVMANARAGDVLFLPALRLPRLSEQWMLFDERQANEQVFGSTAAQVRAAGIVTAVAKLKPLAERGVSIVFEAPKPLLRSPPYRCSDWFNRDNPICARGLDVERPFLEEYRAPALTALKQIAGQLPGASVWDPFPLLCPGATCSAMDQQRPLFFDGDHLSGHGNRKLLPSFSAHLQALTPSVAATSAPEPSGT